MYPSGRQTTVLAGDLDRLSAPVLAVWGSQDPVLPAAHAQALAGRGRVEVLAGARAEQEFPEKVDPDRDADLLRGFDLDPATLVETFSGQSPEVG